MLQELPIKHRFLTAEEKKQFREASDIKGFTAFFLNWSMIIGAFALVAWDMNILTIIIALIILANRQLGLGILLHDCSHRAFFKTRWLNDFMGHWFAGIPTLVPMSFYRDYHLVHHAKTGTEDDPDVGNINSYPVSKKSMWRKAVRDFTGQSGLRVFIGVMFYANLGRAGNAVSLGRHKESVKKNEMIRTGLKTYSHILLVHGIMFYALYAASVPELYLLWWAAFFFVYPFFIRIRQVAEHGAMPSLSGKDIRKTTRSTYARWWERLTFAPNHVNYHCEHHYLPSVPAYKLPELSKLLRDRGFYNGNDYAFVEGGYLEIIRLASSKNS